MDLNKVMIIGRLTRDPELRTIPTGASVCQLGVATNYVYTNQQSKQKVEQVEYHNIVMWGKLAEIANQYLKKGRRVYLEGRLQTRSWDAQDGTKRSRTEIVADNMIMLDGGQANNSGSNNFSSGSTPSKPNRDEFAQASPTDQSRRSEAETEELPTIQQGEDVNVEDIPF
jgi:single-strand DNA-binding protein